ncbi:flagellar motor switch protein FliG [Bacillus sp. C1]
MDKRMLSMLNELQYSEEEIAQLEKEAKRTIEIDKYYVRNGALLRKLILQTLEKTIRDELKKGEEIEKELLVEEGGIVNYKVIPNIMTAGAVFYYYVVLTNKRLLLKGLDCYYKQVNEHEIPLDTIDEISQKEEEPNVYGIKVEKTYIRLGSKEKWEELHEMMLLLKEMGINKGKYNDFEKKFLIGLTIFIVVTQGLLLMKYIL